MAEKAFRSRLKLIFIDYRNFNPQIEAALKELGIIVIRRKRHVVLLVPGYYGFRTVPISSTGSDKRGGLNIVTKIVRAKYYPN